MPEPEVSNQSQDTLPREQSEAEIDAGLEKLKESPTPEVPAEQPQEKPAESYWQKWNVPGLDSEEKAQKWVQDTRNWNLQLAQEVTKLRQAQAQTGQPTKATFEQLLAKHNNNVDAALGELFEEREKGILGKIQEQQSYTAEQNRAAQDILNYAKEGLIPELIPPQYGPNGEVVAEGSEFGREVEGVLSWAQDEFGKIPFSQHPHRAFHAVVYAMGLRSLNEERKKHSGKDVLAKEAGKLAKVSGGGKNISPSSRKNWGSATEEEVDDGIEALRQTSER